MKERKKKERNYTKSCTRDYSARKSSNGYWTQTVGPDRKPATEGLIETRDQAIRQN